MQAQVADVEVAHLVVVAEAVGLAHHRDVNAGLLERLDVFDRDEGDAAPVGLLLGDEAAGVHAVGEAVEAVEVPVADGAAQAEAAVLVVFFFAFLIGVVARRGFGRPGLADDPVEEARQLVGPHPQELDVHLGHVDGDDRQAAILFGWQHHAAAGEVIGRRDGRGAQRQARFGVEPGIAAGRQAGGHLHHVAGLGLDVREEQQARVVAHRPGALDPLAAVGGDVLGVGAGRGGGCGVGALVVAILAGFVAAAAEHLAVPRRHLEDFDLAVVGVAGVEGQAEGEGEGRGAVEITARQLDEAEGAAAVVGLIAGAGAREKVEPGGHGNGQRDQNGNQGKAPAGGGDHGRLPFGRAPPGAGLHDVRFTRQSTRLRPPVAGMKATSAAGGDACGHRLRGSAGDV